MKIKTSELTRPRINNRMLLKIHCWRTQPRSGGRKKVPTDWMITGWVCDCIIDEILAEARE